MPMPLGTVTQKSVPLREYSFWPQESKGSNRNRMRNGRFIV